MKWSIAGSCALGFLCGSMVGASKSQIVATALGAFLGLGGMIVTVTRKDRSAEEIRYLGKTTFAFAVCAWLGIVLGVATRTHNWLGPPRTTERPQPSVALAEPLTADDLASFVKTTKDPQAIRTLLRRANWDGHPVRLKRAELARLIQEVGEGNGPVWVALLNPDEAAPATAPAAREESSEEEGSHLYNGKLPVSEKEE